MTFAALDDDLSGDPRFGDLSALPIVRPDEWRRDLCQQPIGIKASREDDALSGMDWVRKFFPDRVKHDFGEAHREVWAWAELVTTDNVPPPLGLIMPRGGGKTTTLELVILWWLATRRRNFVLYVNSSLVKAAERIKSIQDLMSSGRFRHAYPDVAAPAVGEKGALRGWNNRILRTVSGQIVAGASLDPKTSGRGANEAGERPDALLIDDIDKVGDTPEATAKKENAVLRDILPTEGDTPAAVAYIQNLVIPAGVMARFLKKESEWSTRSTLVGPIPAVDGLEYQTILEDVETPGGTIKKPRHIITAGRPTWSGRPLDACERQMNAWGLHVWLAEQNHVMADFKGAMWRRSMFNHLDKVPSLDTYDRRGVAVDPSGGADVVGIISGGIIFPAVRTLPRETHHERILRELAGEERTIPHQDAPVVHLLYDRSVEPGPDEDWAEAAVLACKEVDGSVVWVEANYGSGMAVKAVTDAAAKLLRQGRIKALPAVAKVWASKSKADRALPAVKMYLDGRVWHAPGLGMLEDEQTTWVPPPSGQRANKSPNRLDAAVHLCNMITAGGRR